MFAKLEVRVIPTRVLFFDDGTYFGIYGCSVHDDDKQKIKNNGWEFNNYNSISIKGSLPMKLDVGKEYTVIISPDTKSTYKGSYNADKLLMKEIGLTPESQRAFLETILAKSQIETIFSVYKDQDVIGLIENNQLDLRKLKGIGEKTLERMKREIAKHKEMSELIAFLSEYDVTYGTMKIIFDKYKSSKKAIEEIKNNPYKLTDVRGIGFKRADSIALNMGFDMRSSFRVESCVKYVLEEENVSGHSWISEKQLINKLVDFLEIEKKYIVPVLENDIEDVLIHDDKYTLKHVFDTEQYVADRIKDFKTKSKQLLPTKVIDEFLDKYCTEHNVELEENQRRFFYDFNENNVLALIGSGGMGKSWLINILLQLLDSVKMNYLLLSPTAKAARVMEGYTKREASTIHRYLINGVVDQDVLIVDESSMCDIFIVAQLFKSINNEDVRILFIGDDFQLPSVSVGNFLFDIINSGVVKISKLKKVFRQKDGGILDAATNVRESKHFLDNKQTGRLQFGKDCVFSLVRQDDIRDDLVKHYKNVLKRFSQEDIVVLSPTRKGKIGTFELNKELQAVVNPPSENKKEKMFGKTLQVTFRVGDLVMHTVNNYKVPLADGSGDTAVFNGDQGKIVDIGEIDKNFIVDFDGKLVAISFEDALKNMMHSYALTIHKSQGSAWKVVMVVIDKSAKFQLNANLIYTSFSRAQQLMLVLGQADTINFGMRKFANMERRSFLKEMLAD